MAKVAAATTVVGTPATRTAGWRLDKTRRDTLAWLAFALAVRLIAAASSLRWQQQDEWLQTVDIAHLLQFGFMREVYEVYGHLRNLTFASLLRAPLAAAQWWAPDDPWVRVYTVKVALGLVDVGVVLGFLRAMLRPPLVLSRLGRNAVYAAFLLPWFSVAEAVRPSLEHASTLACLVAMVLLANPAPRAWSSAALGFVLVLIAALRYPSGLFSAGVLLGLLLEKRSPRRFYLPLAGGLGGGLLLFGAADWYYFGRPWESLWSYAQFNLLSGQAVHQFGRQGSAVYADYLWTHFGNELILLGLPCLVWAVLGLWSALRARRPWAFGVGVYLLGHLLVGHKEGRFLAPMLPLLTWAAVLGLWPRRAWLAAVLHHPRWRWWLRVGLFVTFLANGVAFVVALRGELAKPRSEYFHAVAAARAAQACALITTVDLPASYLYWHAGSALPTLATAQLDLPRELDAAAAPHLALEWLGRQPDCAAAAAVFLHVAELSPYWLAAGCQRQEIYATVAARQIAAWLHGSVLYSCPASILRAFASPKEIKFIFGFRPFPTLPLRAMPREEYLRFVDGPAYLSL